MGDLPGSRVELPLSLLGLMGDLGTADLSRRERFKVMVGQMEAEGRSKGETEVELRSRYTQEIAGRVFGLSNKIF